MVVTERPHLTFVSGTVNHFNHLWEKRREREGKREGEGEGISLRVGNLMPCGLEPEHRVKDCVG